MSKESIIFFSSGNSVRSQMAEGFARNLAGEGIEVFSAGCDSADPVHPFVIDVMQEFGIDISSQSPTLMSELAENHFDLSISLSSCTQSDDRTLAGTPAIIEWDIDHPLTETAREADLKKSLRQCAEKIKTMVSDLFKQGYYDAFVTQQNNLNSVLNSFSDAVIAHDLQRRIFFFSEGASQMTGLKPSQVIGKDCNSVFKPRFCGENCSFCFDRLEPDFQGKNYATVFHGPEGNRMELDANLIPLKNTRGAMTGVMVSMRDVSDLKMLERELKQQKSFRGIIGSDPKMIQLFQQIKDLAAYDYPVHIHGETGVGKELVAKAIHEESIRSNALFVPINCGALPEGLVESELFGHVKGSFSGAIRNKKGRFEMADKGTAFLDEVADLPKSVQVKLLRFLQEGTLEKVGSESPISVDVRVISATNKDLKEETKRGNFREDLYYRLNVIPIKLPPLKDRKNDILPLCDHFLKQAVHFENRTPHTISHKSLSAMMDYHWPGNIRELENAIRFSMVKSRGQIIQPQDLPLELQKIPKNEFQKGPEKKLDLKSVEKALEKAGGNKAKAARLLGVGRATIYRFLGQHPEILVE
ncbi:MAG: sigma 54-interacting transcriptional regulator [Deltaproteobacteria bacterium]|nr:sigma 54-interacting transcriptional regulator [Deltaproteobacteria bacterium]MBT4267334.1 sigma 54-interacting transcriptional regulator [Deltaproteobacteria bacterium]MBT4643174.1 sigma 54-interacting transcriptional regulator [Deltaproteobacteria bacterium]MBT6500196.1 sigma 54-interacting transcriptional regulator [Deltaproteobacteria bacterium]MBT6616112.1 sigma 54-interacting transcriptional regulator [Deltaproteobacteria bacterium]